MEAMPAKREENRGENSLEAMPAQIPTEEPIRAGKVNIDGYFLRFMM